MTKNDVGYKITLGNRDCFHLNSTQNGNQKISTSFRECVLQEEETKPSHVTNGPLIAKINFCTMRGEYGDTRRKSLSLGRTEGDGKGKTISARVATGRKHDIMGLVRDVQAQQERALGGTSRGEPATTKSGGVTGPTKWQVGPTDSDSGPRTIKSGPNVIKLGRHGYPTEECQARCWDKSACEACMSVSMADTHRWNTEERHHDRNSTTGDDVNVTTMNEVGKKMPVPHVQRGGTPGRRGIDGGTMQGPQ
jgi:hypothetical protein